MIIARSPLRISLGGGGTDLPSYYKAHTGFLIAAAIDKYVYITLHETFVQELVVKYSEMEKVKSVDQIKHPIVREALRLLALDKDPHLEITSMADIPAGTGLGSSGSFTAALLRALYTYKKEFVSAEEIAQKACHIELDILKEPIGKQDQYIASYGGINAFTFMPDGRVMVEPLKMKKETLYSLEDNLMLFFTGITRSASSILKEQDSKSKEADQDMIRNLHYVKELGLQSRQCFETGNLRGFAEIMNEHWQYKKKRSGSMTSSKIDECYDLAIKNGAVGGKLIGAGGGGFLMFYTEDKQKLRNAMVPTGLSEVRFSFDFEGTKVIS